MNTSNAVVQISKTEAQKGFSLIELLVVVAIIGVLAAAGIVGYQSYLDGVKTDTHKNNAISLSKGLQVAATAKSSGLTIKPDGCANNASGPVSALDCARAIAIDGKFKSPLSSAAALGSYIGSNGACGATNEGLLVLSGSGNTWTVQACGPNSKDLAAGSVSSFVW